MQQYCNNKADILLLQQSYSNLATKFHNIYELLQSYSKILSQCFYNLSVLYRLQYSSWYVWLLYYYYIIYIYKSYKKQQEENYIFVKMRALSRLKIPREGDSRSEI